VAYVIKALIIKVIGFSIVDEVKTKETGDMHYNPYKLIAGKAFMQ